jgi:hypothetical protein
MKRKLILLATLTFVVGVAFAKISGVIELGSPREPAAPRVGDELSAGRGAARDAQVPLPAACLSPEDASDAVRKLSSGVWSQIKQAREFFLHKSGESETCRAEAISTLMRAMDKPDLDFMGNEESYHLWLYGAELLGDLKAAEAIDFLVAHLGLIDDASYSMSMRHQPALLGLIHMGEIAIPKLDEVLRHNPDWQRRHNAVYCIATIGGPQAVNSLSQALSSESDKCVSRFIRISLDSFDEKGRIKNRLEWSRGVSCS